MTADEQPVRQVELTNGDGILIRQPACGGSKVAHPHCVLGLCGLPITGRLVQTIEGPAHWICWASKPYTVPLVTRSERP